MKNNSLILAVLVILMLGLSSCFKPQYYPPEPQIEFTEFIFIDTVDILGNPGLVGSMQFYFIDGDGNIGYDTTTPRINTIFLDKFAIHNGNEIQVELLVPLEYYVPRFEISEPDLALKGDMIVEDLNETYPFKYDTIMYKFYIVDRDGNKSNVETTGWLFLNEYLND